LEVSIEEMVENIKGGEGLGEVLLKISLEIAREFYRKVLELVDTYLFRTKDRRLKSEGLYPRWVISPLGSIRIRRRKYRDGAGGYHYLLDELIGCEGKSPLTPELKKGCAYLTTLLPFQKSAQVMEQTLPEAAISHATVHRVVKRIAKPVIKEEEDKKTRTYEWGEIPDGGERVVSRLLVEADGVNISLQREKKDKAEIKVGIAYEGWELVSKGRYKVQQKTSYCALDSERGFWEGFSLKLAHRYDLSRINDIVVGGDGASWVKSGVELLGGRFQLDRFHLLRGLRQALSQSRELVYPVYQACNQGNYQLALSYLDKAKGEATGEEKQKIKQIIGYISDNAAGLRDYRLDAGAEGQHLRRTGAIESNVDKLVANRMKKRGMSWTIAGAKYMACLLMVAEDGRLSQVCRPDKKEKPLLPVRTLRRILVKNYKEAADKWLQASLPALYGPHVNRPWVKSLKHISEVSFSV
jgi:hypothetical protein